MDRRKQERPEAQVITPELLAKIAERAKEIERVNELVRRIRVVDVRKPFSLRRN